MLTQKNWMLFSIQFRAENETRTPAKKPEFFTLYVNPQSGIRLTAPRGRSRVRISFSVLLNAKKLDAFQHPISSGKRDSNSRPQPWQGCALPTELFPQYVSLELGLQRYGYFSFLQTFLHIFSKSFLLLLHSVLLTADLVSIKPIIMKKNLLVLAAFSALALASCSKEQENNEPVLEYGGVTYKIVKLKDGKWWMAENLRYVPEGITVSDDPTKTSPIWYPYSSNGSEITVLKDEESISKLGYLYNPAFALGVDEITADNYNTLEGVQGICPEGWHIPTWEDYFGLCGVSNTRKLGEAAPSNNTEAIFYDTEKDNGSIVKADAEGFNYTFCGCINGSKYQTIITKEETCSVESYIGNNALSYYLSSTGYQSKSSYQMFGLMSTFSKTFTYGKLSLSYFNLAGGAGVRCVKD